MQKQFNDWFLTYSYGQSGLGLAWQAARCDDFVFKTATDGGFKALMKELHKKLERSKYAHFDLCGEQAAPVVFADYLDGFTDYGVCKVNDKAPAADKDGLSDLAQDQIHIGEWLIKHQRLIISRDKIPGLNSLKIPLFGYALHFTGSEEDSGKFGKDVDNGNIRRVFDFSPAAPDPKKVLWNGYARRNISGYVPYFKIDAEWQQGKYKNCQDENKDANIDGIKTLNHLACEDLWLDKDGKWKGINALAVLKGDIDDLGALFQNGLEQPTFAKMAALSRQVNHFFAIYLPWLCETQYPETYIVFAGGDDFFLLGSWKQLMQLAAELRREFSRYVADNADIHFSAGLSVTKPKIPIHQLAAMGEEALEQAKAYKNKTDGTVKNAVTCFKQTVNWADFERLCLAEGSAEQRLEQLRENYDLSTAYIYGLLRLTDRAADNAKPENALWRSQLYYRTYRMLVNNRRLKDSEQKRRACQVLVTDIGGDIEQFGSAYHIALHTYLYQNRNQN